MVWLRRNSIFQKAQTQPFIHQPVFSQMNTLKKAFGIAWLLAGLATVVYLPLHAAPIIAAGKTEDIVFWTIMVFIFIPIALGFSLFGWYAWKGDYNK